MTVHSQVSAFGALLLFQSEIEVNGKGCRVLSYFAAFLCDSAPLREHVPREKGISRKDAKTQRETRPLPVVVST